MLKLEKSISIIFSHSQNIYAQLDNLFSNNILIKYIPLFVGIDDFLKGTIFPSIFKEVLLSFNSLKLHDNEWPNYHFHNKGLLDDYNYNL